MNGIVDVQLERLTDRLAHRNITLNLDQASKEWLADEGYDPAFGARPLKRVIQRTLQNQLAEMLLANEVVDGDSVPIMVGPDGLIVGDRLSSSSRVPQKKLMVH
jgi:ATP-dependent Clp protease ATP-binding subunit ClpB